MMLMAKRPNKQPRPSWAIYYHIPGGSAEFVTIVHEQPDEQAAIAQALKKLKIGPRGFRMYVLV